MDSVQGETLAVSATGIVVDNKHNSLLLLQRHRHRLTDEDFRKALAPGEKVLLEGKVKKRCVCVNSLILLVLLQMCVQS